MSLTNVVKYKMLLVAILVFITPIEGAICKRGAPLHLSNPYLQLSVAQLPVHVAV